MAIPSLPVPADGGLKSIADLYSLINGQTTSTPDRIETTSTSQQGMDALLSQLLSGTNGLSAVAGAQRSAGGYGGSTNTLLTNDLITRAAGQVASQNQTRTTSGGKTTVGGTTGAGVGNTLGSLALGQGTAFAGKKLKDLFTTGGLLGAGGVAAGDAFLPGALDSVTGQVAGDAFLPGNLAQFGSIGTEAFDASGLVEAGSSGSFAGGDLLGTLGGVGELGAGLEGVAAADAAFTAGGVLGTGEVLAGIEGVAGFAEGATLLTTAGEVATVAEGFAIEEILLAVLAWIICTELASQRKMPARYYIHGAKAFSKYPEQGKLGYYLWAIPSVKHLRAYPDSLYSKFLKVIFNWRAENIAAHAGVGGARKLWKGAAVTAVLYPICWTLGHTVCRLSWFKQRSNYEVVYGG